MRFEYIVFGMFGLMAVAMLFKVIQNGGFKGAAFGAPLREQVSEMRLGQRGMTRTMLKVHVLEPRDPADGPHIGVEVLHSTLGSAWKMSPIPLTRTEAQRFAEELSRAAGESIAGAPTPRLAQNNIPIS
jgi:hypothetical protein